MNDKAALQEMIPAGCGVVAAVSGGADSVALLHFLHSKQAELGFHLFACHLNHCLRGAESERDERFVRELCDQLGVALLVARADIAALAAERKISIELSAREERYALYAKAAAHFAPLVDVDADIAPDMRIATGHTLSDSAETVLINLARGTGLRGLCGIPAVNGATIRPLLDCTRAETEAYCRTNGLAWVEDSTNSLDLYTRNRVRNHVIPALTAMNPSLLPTIARETALLRRDADFLDGLGADALENITMPKGFSREGFLALPAAISSRVLLLLFRQNAITADTAKCELCAKIVRDGGALELSRGVYFRAQDKLFHISETKQPPEPFEVHEIKLQIGEEYNFNVLSGKKLSIIPLDYEYFAKTYNSGEKLLKNLLDYDKIVGIIQFRPRRTGDSIRLHGRGCTKTLRRLYSESNVPVEQRAQLAVLADEAGVLWVEGFGVSERAAPNAATRHAIELRVHLNARELGQ